MVLIECEGIKCATAYYSYGLGQWWSGSLLQGIQDETRLHRGQASKETRKKMHIYIICVRNRGESVKLDHWFQPTFCESSGSDVESVVPFQNVKLSS